MIMKKCTTCEEVKELSEFYNEKRRKDGKKSVCKDCCKIKTKQWIEKNKERYQKVYKENGKVYYKKNKESIKEKVKKYRDNNKDRYKEYFKIHNQENKEKISEYNKLYQQENKEKIKEYKKLYYQENKKKRNEQTIKRYKTDVMFNIKSRVRNRINKAFTKKGYTKKSKTELILGADWLTVKKHFERQFTKGMSWENREKWHIDHIVPLASAKTEEEVVKLNHYTNLQPLWAEDNLKKSDTIINGTQTTLGI